MALWFNFLYNKGIVLTQSQFCFCLEDTPLTALLLSEPSVSKKKGQRTEELELVKISIKPQVLINPLSPLSLVDVALALSWMHCSL